MQTATTFNVPSVDGRRNFLKSDKCFLNSFIGNEEAIRRLSRAVFSALGKPDHCCADYSFALCGPPSTGKTHLAKLFAKTLSIPFAVIEPQMIKRVHDIFYEIENACINHSQKTPLFDYGDNTYFLPPVVVFIDEVHNLKSNVVQGLLKATEPTDRLMITEEGYTCYTNNICWMIATTDRGDLFDAFDTRFQKISLRLYSKKEIAQIIKMSNKDWSDDICLLVANYNSQVPREALAFARDMRVEHEMNPRDWVDVAKTVAKDHGIDEFGLSNVRVSVLKALGQNPISNSQLTFIAHVKEEELKKYIMPPLLSRTPDQPVPLVSVSNRGYCITPAGLHELNIRGIKNRGMDAIPENVRPNFEGDLVHV